MSSAKTSVAVGWIFFANAVYNTGGVVSPSAAYIDASAVAQQSDICATLFSIISAASYPGHAAVIDARGIKNTTGSPNMLTCNSGSPWTQGTGSRTNSNTTTNPATILLPAGTIYLSTSWILPNFAQIVGEGKAGTVMKACSTGTAGCSANFAPPAWDNSWPGGPAVGVNAMVELGSPFGTSTSCGSQVTCFCPGGIGNTDCNSVGVRDLTLDGAGQNINGIVNQVSQELTFVDDVALNNIEGIGLWIGNDANPDAVTTVGAIEAGNSGPYSNIVFNAGAAASTTECVNLQAGTRGIHQISCTATGNPAAAIYLDGYNNSVADVQISGFTDGVLIGSQALSTVATNSRSNLLLNVAGISGVTNVVHICGPNPPSSLAACAETTNPTADVTILGTSNLGALTSSNNLVRDDETETALGGANVAMYVLGEQTPNGSSNQYTRFTTAPKLPTWATGSVAITANSACTGNGTLYSRDVPAAGTTLWACVNGVWTPLK
jgi:hypothetical protein